MHGKLPHVALQSHPGHSLILPSAQTAPNSAFTLSILIQAMAVSSQLSSTVKSSSPVLLWHVMKITFQLPSSL